MKTGKFYCKGCEKKIFLKEKIKKEQKVKCHHCGYNNFVKRDNGKIKTT